MTMTTTSSPLTCDCWVAKAPRTPFVKDTVTLPPLGHDEVEVKMLATGVCASDIDAMDRTSFLFKFPMIPGHEGIGLVTAVGSEVPSALVQVGTRVGIGCYRKRCNACRYCFQGENNLCLKRELTFMSGREGAFSTTVRIHYEFAIPIPDALSTIKAAPLLCAGVTVFAPFKQHNVRPGDNVGIVGIGGLGHLAIQFADKMGCTVTAISQTEGKADLAKKLGADHFLLLKNADQVKAATSTLDFILVTAGGDDGFDWKTLFDLLAPNGKIVLVGVVLNDLRVPAVSLLMGQKSIAGSAAGSTAVAHEMLRFAAAQKVEPMVETYPFDQVNEVADKVRNNQLRFRAVLCHDQSLLQK